jgi:hypothetical protein
MEKYNNPDFNKIVEADKQPKKIEQEMTIAERIHENSLFFKAILKKLNTDEFSELLDDFKRNPEKLARYEKYSNEHSTIRDAARMLPTIDVEEFDEMNQSLDTIHSEIGKIEFSQN